MHCKIIIEQRPRLQSCHFYIITNFSAKDLLLKVNLNSVELISKEHLEISLPDICLIPESLSGLTVGDHEMSFHLQTNSKSLQGSFKTEFINQNKGNETLSEYKPQFDVDSSMHLFCNCCLNKLTKIPVIFKRILPLPSSNFDISDLFCHQEKNLDHLNTEPKQNDCLYGSYFVIINDVLKQEDGILHCDRCYSWLGIRHSNSIQLWNSTVLFSNKKPIRKNKALTDFISVVKELSDGKYGISKIIMQCRMTSIQTHYLMLWIIEKKLKLLIHSSEKSFDVVLEEHEVIKLLFQFETIKTDDVKSWQKDLYVINTEVSKQMLVEGLKYLYNMSCNIPEDYRSVNKMSVSYIGMLK